jgi:hypothetical protein
MFVMELKERGCVEILYMADLSELHAATLS